MRRLQCLLLPAFWLACGHTPNSAEPSSSGASQTGASGAASSDSAGTGTGATATGAGAGAAGSANTNPAGGSGTASGGTNGSGGSAPAPGSLGAYPYTASPVTRGGTMTFTNVGAAGWWPRRIDRAAGDPACNVKDGTDTWGAHCCLKQNATTSTALSPFDEEMTLILKAIDVKQLAIYQPDAAASSTFKRVTSWDRRTGTAQNLWFTQTGAGSAQFSGDLTRDDCVGYLTQAPNFDCGDGRDYFCPADPGVLHRGFSGSKLVVFLASMTFPDSNVKACGGSAAGAPGPWVAFVASELVRDGGRKWNGLCNCYSKTGSVGDGCGEINLFEVVMDNNAFSNREFASTGVRSFQAGHVGGAVCQATCDRNAFAADADVVDACAHQAYARGPVLVSGGTTDGCPVWRRPEGDRYFFVLLDQSTRSIQVGMVHPAKIPSAMASVLPELPGALSRTAIDAIAGLRLPE